MSQRWLNFLEKFGSKGRSSQVLDADDVFRGLASSPGRLLRYDSLFHLYGPLANTPWIPYHCPTLFASIDKLGIIPQEVELSRAFHAPRHPDVWKWLRPDSMVLVDLPGGTSIEVGVLLMRKGAQFISTFDHWAFSSRQRTARPVLPSKEIIDKIFTLATEVHRLRPGLSPDAAPLWLCDNRRLKGVLSPSPGTFDNRYYIDDSILPGIQTLKGAGIRRVVHITMADQPEPLPDLVPFIIEAHEAGIRIETVILQDENTWITPLPMRVPFRRKLMLSGFRRTDMGGFGQMVPMPSEGSYSSGGRAG